ncbi:MAG: hypothetical protein FWG48_01135 [Oscillospiraceae bacterium]|nr:hypothetical protein [Oscillospiraceae bacterium]
MFGTYERFNLVRCSFARSGSNTYIAEDYHKHGLLRIGNNWTGESVNSTDFLFDVKMTMNGTPVKYTYFADEGSVKLEANGAVAEIALTDRSHFRIRGAYCGLRLELRSASGKGAAACRGMYAMQDGSGWEGEFGRFGKLFFRALSGNFSVASIFDDSKPGSKGEYSLVRIDFMPDAATGEFDAAIHDYRDKLLPFGEYEDFSDLVEDNCAEFAEFTENYLTPAKGYEEMSKYAMWVVWSHRTKVIGNFKQPHILYQNAWSCAAAPWQQSYNAMAMLANPAEAWRLNNVMFQYQNPLTGHTPNMMTYANAPAGGVQPAFQGFALDYLIRKLGDGFISEDEAERVYPQMSAWAEYWTTYHNAGFGDDVIAMHSPHESGWDDSSIFQDGFPAVDPCANTFIILLMEAVALLAGRSYSYKDKRDAWAARSEKLLNTLVSEYWDGEKFIARVKGKPVDSFSLANYQPIILGKRLPQHIIDKVAEKLTEEGCWLTDIGLASESMQSERATFGISFVCGRVVGPMNMILTVGLQAAGKQKEADFIARRYCDHTNREGIILGYAPYNYYLHNGEKAAQQVPPIATDGWPWSSWSANSYLTMVTGVIGK